MNCESCGEKRKGPDSVPFIVHESGMARLERTIKKLWILLIVTLLLLFGTNLAWVIYESQFEDIVITAEQEADDGSNNYAVGGDYYGSKAESDG